MRVGWLAISAGVWLALSGCSGDRDQAKGGGGGNWEPTHDRSNPTTREQEHDNGALPLQAIPQEGRAVSGDGVEDSRTTVIARDGQPVTRVDVNTASLDQLIAVPGISANLAQAIINNRPYRDASDLTARIPHLDRRQVASFSPYLTFGPDTTRR